MLRPPPQYKNTPLHGAADSGHKDVAELLLGHKADVNSVNGVSADGCAGGGGREGGVFEGVFPLRVCEYLVCVCWVGGHGCCILFCECRVMYIYI